jgi:ribulose-bisphosphate carboxylase large chain
VFFSEPRNLELSGNRFSVTYKIHASKEEAFSLANGICLEQTVEFPRELVPDGSIKDSIVGRIESFEQWEKKADCYKTVISYAEESAADELTQLLNVIFGNSSIKPGIRVEHIDIPAEMLKSYQGPRFGAAGLRKYLGIEKRPILFTAIKPMGLSAEDLAELAYQFAVGGIDLIKDDHGISNHSFSPYEKRVELCAAAVARANRETGLNCIYMPNITAPYDKIIGRARYAKAAGAGALLISPGLTGIDVIRQIAEDDDIALPIFSHPAFQGSYVLDKSGISHAVMLGQIPRLAGADATIYPNFGGRFSFSQDECRQIVKGCSEPMDNIKTILPCPAGGINLENVPECIEFYGKDVVLLIGGGLFKHGPNLVENSRYFREIVEKLSDKNQ